MIPRGMGAVAETGMAATMVNVAAVTWSSLTVVMTSLGVRTASGTTDAVVAVMSFLTAVVVAPAFASTSISRASPAPLDVDTGHEQGRPPGARNDELRR